MSKLETIWVVLLLWLIFQTSADIVITGTSFYYNFALVHELRVLWCTLIFLVLLCWSLWRSRTGFRTTDSLIYCLMPLRQHICPWWTCSHSFSACKQTFMWCLTVLLNTSTAMYILPAFSCSIDHSHTMVDSPCFTAFSAQDESELLWCRSTRSILDAVVEALGIQNFADTTNLDFCVHSLITIPSCHLRAMLFMRCHQRWRNGIEQYKCGFWFCI